MQAFAAASYVLSSDERSYNYMGSLASIKVMHVAPHMPRFPVPLSALSLTVKATHTLCCTDFTMTASPLSMSRELFQLGVRCFDIDIVITADQQLLVAHPAAVQVSYRRTLLQCLLCNFTFSIVASM